MMLTCRRRKNFAETGRRGNGHENGAKWEPKWLPKWSQNGSLGGPWAKLCDFGGFREDVVFLIFLIGDKSAEKSLKIRPGSSRGAPRNARVQNTLAGPVPKEGGREETGSEVCFSEILKKRRKEGKEGGSTRSTGGVGGFRTPTPRP